MRGISLGGNAGLSQEQVLKLVKLARDRSKSARSELVENITDMFLSEGGRLSEHERALMSDILSKLISSVEKTLRKQLSESLARSDAQLPEVAEVLARDDIDIARPILEHSDLLKDQKLIEIIRIRTDEHRLSIAIRESVSEDVSDALVEYGSQDVVEALLKNPDANISKWAMEYLVAESRRVDRFQEPLISRDDLPSELAYRMYWWVSAALRKRILSEFQVDPVMLDEAVQRATHQAIAEHGDGSNSTFVKAQRLVRRMNENDELTHKFIIQALRQQKIAVFVAGLAELANIDFQTAWQIFSDKRSETIAVLAKAITMERTDFSSVFLLVSKARDSDSVHSPSELKGVMDMYDKINYRSARGALQFWQQNKIYQEAVDALA